MNSALNVLKSVAMSAVTQVGVFIVISGYFVYSVSSKHN